MSLARKKAIYVVIGVAISGALIWMLLRNIEMAKLATVLSDVNYFWLIPNLLLVVGAIYQRAIRWKFMLKPIKQVRYSNLLAATSIGFMANNVLPLRLGEFVRAYSLTAQDSDISKTTSLATIFVERIVFDLIALLLILGGIIFLSDLTINPVVIYGAYTAIAIALVGVLFMLALALRPKGAGRIIVRYLFFLPAPIKERIQDMVFRFSSGLEFIKSGSDLTMVSFHTLLIWFGMGLSNYFVFLAFDFGLPLTASFFLLVVVSIGILIPSSPGFVGVYHTFTVLALKAYDIPLEDSISFAIVLHAAQYIPITVMGFYFLKKEHLSLRRLEAEATGATVSE